MELSVSHYLLARGLERAKLTEKDLKVVNTSDADLVAAFATDDVTAVATWNPLLAEIEGVLRETGQPALTSAQIARMRPAMAALRDKARTLPQLLQTPHPLPAVTFLSGPEGGLAASEEQAAAEAGFVPVTLGPRTLRAETAPLAALAALDLWGVVPTGQH